MKINAPDIYFNKKIKVVSPDGQELIGELYGYDYDFTDDGVEYLEFDVETENGMIVSYTEDEIESIEVLNDR